VTPADRKNYEEDGAICLRGVFDLDWVETLKEAALRHTQNHQAHLEQVWGWSREKGPNQLCDSLMALTDPGFARFMRPNPAADVAAELLKQKEVRFFYDQLFIKNPPDQKDTSGNGLRNFATEWHQDLSYWPVRGDEVISIWIALTDVNGETSGLRYVAGSHKWGKLYRAGPSAADTDVTAEDCPDFDLPKNAESHRILRWDMAPGDIICHHPLAVHGARPNMGKTPRMAVSVRYMGRGVAWMPQPFVPNWPGSPEIERGAYPADDRVFPLLQRTVAA
jgi:ectoine hydroxylase-related dioxygenase (phytanoyl-CoA dioxygenase family)